MPPAPASAFPRLPGCESLEGKAPAPASAFPRVAHIITGLGGGGAERFLTALLPRLAPPEETAVWSIQRPGINAPRLEEAGYAPLTLGARRGWPPSPWAWWRLRRWLGQWKPDVLCGWMYHGNLAATLAAAGRSSAAGPRRGAGLVWCIHQTPAGAAREKWLTRRVIGWGRRHSGRPDAIVYVSEASRSLHREMGYDDRRSHVARNGFDLGQYVPAQAARRLEARRALGLPEDARVIFRAARLDPMKDYPTLLDAFALAAGRVPDAWLVLAGEGVEQENSAFSAWRKRHPEAASRVRWLGWRDDLPALLHAADVAVSSSAMKEAFPLALGEAMACGVPCVATDVGDSAALVGAAGRVAPPGDPERLADALVEVLRLPEGERRALGARARRRVEEMFSIERAAERYREIFIAAAGRPLSAACFDGATT